MFFWVPDKQQLTKNTVQGFLGVSSRFIEMQLVNIFSSASCKINVPLTFFYTHLCSKRSNCWLSFWCFIFFVPIQVNMGNSSVLSLWNVVFWTTTKVNSRQLTTLHLLLEVFNSFGCFCRLIFVFSNSLTICISLQSSNPMFSYSYFAGTLVWNLNVFSLHFCCFRLAYSYCIHKPIIFITSGVLLFFSGFISTNILRQGLLPCIKFQITNRRVADEQQNKAKLSVY